MLFGRDRTALMPSFYSRASPPPQPPVTATGEVDDPIVTAPARLTASIHVGTCRRVEETAATRLANTRKQTSKQLGVTGMRSFRAFVHPSSSDASGCVDVTPPPPPPPPPCPSQRPESGCCVAAARIAYMLSVTPCAPWAASGCMRCRQMCSSGAERDAGRPCR